MERCSSSDQPSIHHSPGLSGCCPHTANPELLRKGAHTLTGEPPRVFALVQEFGEDDETGEGGEEIVTEVVAYGLALPDGTAATVGLIGHGFGRWRSPYSAASRLHSDLVWLGEEEA